MWGQWVHYQVWARLLLSSFFQPLCGVHDVKADVFIKKWNRIKRIGPYKQILELDFIKKKKKEKGKKSLVLFYWSWPNVFFPYKEVSVKGDLTKGKLFYKIL